MLRLKKPGVSGVPIPSAASNTLRKETELKLSVRLPPPCDPTKCNEEMKRVLEANPPYGARVIYEAKNGNFGWAAPKLVISINFSFIIITITIYD
jgi:hypothetical protein